MQICDVTRKKVKIKKKNNARVSVPQASLHKTDAWLFFCAHRLCKYVFWTSDRETGFFLFQKELGKGLLDVIHYSHGFFYAKQKIVTYTNAGCFVLRMIIQFVINIKDGIIDQTNR